MFETQQNIPEQSRDSQANRNVEALICMLQEVGLADIQPRTTAEARPNGRSPNATQDARRTSELLEIPLGSLDRPKVSLGETERTTDSNKFIRDEWGTDGTMLKILRATKDGLYPLEVSGLLARGPVLPGCGRKIA